MRLALGVQRVALDLNAVQAQLNLAQVAQAPLMHHLGAIALRLGGVGHAAFVQQLDAVAVLLGNAPGHLLVLGQPLGAVLLGLVLGQGQAGNGRLAGGGAGQALFVLGLGVFHRRNAAQQQRQHDAAQHQGEQNRPCGQKDEQIALGKDAAIGQMGGNRQRSGQRHRTANARHGGGQGEQSAGALDHAALAVRLVQRAAHAQHQPGPAQRQQGARDGGHIAQQQPDIAVRCAAQRLANDRGQLQPQQQKDGPVKSGLDHAPGAFGLQAFRDEVAAVQIGKIGSYTRSHGGQNTRHSYVFAHDIRRKGQQNQEQHHLRGGHIAHAAGDHVAPTAKAPAHQSAQPQAAHRHPGEILGGVFPAERTGGQRGGDSKFQCHQARGIVQQRLALQQVHGFAGHAQVARNGRDGHRIGGRDHGGQGKGHGQRNAGNQPVNEVAQAKYGDEHQAKGQQQNRLGQGKKFALGNAPAVGKQQRRNEQQQKQLGVKGNVQAILRPGNQRPQGNLNQRQGNGPHVTRGNAGQGPQHQYQQDGFDSVHNVIVSAGQGGFSAGAAQMCEKLFSSEGGSL